jgi:hypothetical protein
MCERSATNQGNQPAISVLNNSRSRRGPHAIYFFSSLRLITLGSSHRDRAKTVPSDATLLTILAFLRSARGVSRIPRDEK